MHTGSRDRVRVAHVTCRLARGTVGTVKIFVSVGRSQNIGTVWLAASVRYRYSRTRSKVSTVVCIHWRHFDLAGTVPVIMRVPDWLLLVCCFGEPGERSTNEIWTR
eukprot:COSAG05_NODE_235_length_13191_cov_7.667354_8_plen_106_part_00